MATAAAAAGALVTEAVAPTPTPCPTASTLATPISTPDPTPISNPAPTLALGDFDVTPSLVGWVTLSVTATVPVTALATESGTLPIPVTSSVTVSETVAGTVRRIRLTAGSLETAAHKKSRKASSHSLCSRPKVEDEDGGGENVDVACRVGGAWEGVIISPDSAARNMVSQSPFVE